MVTAVMSYSVIVSGATDVGQVRESNEDVWGQVPELNFYALADGMGGHQAGEIAAEQAIKILCDIVRREIGPHRAEITFHDMRKEIFSAIQQVNAAVYKMSRLNSQFYGMGTTLCCLLFLDKGLVYAHVGDSRIYRMHKGKLQQLTKDHSLLSEMGAQGATSKGKSVEVSYKNIITKAIGTEPIVDPTVHLCDVESGDLFMMCSDGLSEMLSLKEMQAIILQQMSIDETALELIATANARGGYDNITVVLAQVEGDEENNLSR